MENWVHDQEQEALKYSVCNFFMNLYTLDFLRVPLYPLEGKFPLLKTQI